MLSQPGVGQDADAPVVERHERITALERREQSGQRRMLFVAVFHAAVQLEPIDSRSQIESRMMRLTIDPAVDLDVPRLREQLSHQAGHQMRCKLEDRFAVVVRPFLSAAEALERIERALFGLSVTPNRARRIGRSNDGGVGRVGRHVDVAVLERQVSPQTIGPALHRLQPNRALRRVNADFDAQLRRRVHERRLLCEQRIDERDPRVDRDAQPRRAAERRQPSKRAAMIQTRRMRPRQQHIVGEDEQWIGNLHSLSVARQRSLEAVLTSRIIPVNRELECPRRARVPLNRQQWRRRRLDLAYAGA